MRRRWWGCLSVVVALVAAMVVGTVAKAFPGTPTASHIGDPPAVGACMTAPVPTGASSTQDRIDYPVLTTGACTGARFGEVIGVLPDGLTWHPDTVREAPLNEPASPESLCAAMVERYVGLPQRGDGVVVGWRPSGPVGTVIGQPSPLQTSIGRTWVICTAVVFDQSGFASLYSRTLKDAYRQRLPPPEAAVCVQDPLPTNGTHYRMAACSSPHQVEVFGSAAGSAPTDVAALTTRCQTLVRQTTGMPDPSAGGRLTIQVVTAITYTFKDAGSIDTSVPPGIGYTCTVSASGAHRLTGPLLGLGSGAVPLT